MGIASILVAAAIIVGPPQNGSTIHARVGTALVVRLPGNATTGFRWLPAGVAAGLRLTSTRYLPAKPVRPGSGGTFVFRFAVRGSGRVQLVYRRPWERNTPPAERYSVRVAVTR